MSETKERKRHPSTLISDEIVREIAYRLHLRRLEPPLTPEESRDLVRQGKRPQDVWDDAHRRKVSTSLCPLVRETLRVMVDMELARLPAETLNNVN